MYKAIHTICDDDTVLALDSLVRNGFGKIDGEEHRVHLPADWVERSFQQHCPSFSRFTG